MTKFPIFTYGLALLLPACNSAGSATPGGSGGTPATGSAGHTSAGTAGMAVSIGGATSGSGGAPSASAGQPAGGSGNAMAGSAGSAAGSGGAAAGAAGSSAGGSAGSVAAGGAAGGSSTAVTVQRASTLQTIDGFGLNTALSNPSVNWDTFYGTGTNGLGLSIVRVAMDSGGKLNGVMPPSSYNAKVIASPWTAPGNCKDNGTTTKGGHLLKSCYDSWSTTIANFAKAQNLYAIAAANEPDFASCGSTIGPPCNGDYDSMVFTANEMVEWVKVLGPKLKALNPPVKFIAPEPSEWIHLWSNMSATGSTVSGHPNSSDPLKCGCFGNTPGTTGCASTCAQGNGYDYGHFLAKDTTAWPLIDIIGTHEYDTQKAEAWPADVDGGKRSKPIWETEVSGVMYWPEQGASTDIKNGIAVAGWIHSALTVGEASAWLYWWYEASGDNEGLLIKGSSALTKRCYTLGNYSKFVRPGYTRVNVTGAVPTDVLLSAYTGEDGTVVVVAINKGSAAVSVPIAIAGGTAAPTMMTPYVTSATDSLTAKTAVAVSGGAFTAMLDSMSVTTFVGK